MNQPIFLGEWAIRYTDECQVEPILAAGFLKIANEEARRE